MKDNMNSAGKVLKIIGFVFLLVSILELVIAGVFYVEANHFKNNAVKTSAVIVEKGNSTVVDYSFEGEDYRNSFNMNNSSWKIGDSIEIYVNKSNPDDVRAGGALFYLVSIVLAASCAPLLLTGCGLFIAGSVGSKRKNSLLDNGTKVWGTVVESKVNWSVQVGRRHPEYILCRVIHPLTGEEVTVKSESVFQELSLTEGKRVAIYFDSNKEKKYFVDVDSINV